MGKNIDCCHYYIYCCSVKKFCFDEIFEHFPGKFKHFAEKFDRFTGKFDHSFFAKEIEQKICNKKCKFLGSLWVLLSLKRHFSEWMIRRPSGWWYKYPCVHLIRNCITIPSSCPVHNMMFAIYISIVPSIFIFTTRGQIVHNFIIPIKLYYFSVQTEIFLMFRMKKK